MPRLQWRTGAHEVGVSHGVFYPPDGPGVVWNGLVSVQENPDVTDQISYLDGVRIRNGHREDSFSATLSAFSFPDPFIDVLGSRRPRSFGLSYRVETETGYHIHLVYNALPTPSGIEHSQNSPGEYSWQLTTTPGVLPVGEVTAHLIIDAAVAYPPVLAALEDTLYGSEAGEATLPSLEDIWNVFDENALLVVVDNGDGTFTVTGPASAITMLDSTTFEITWPSAVYINSDTYKISSF